MTFTALGKSEFVMLTPDEVGQAAEAVFKKELQLTSTFARGKRGKIERMSLVELQDYFLALHTCWRGEFGLNRMSGGILA